MAKWLTRLRAEEEISNSSTEGTDETDKTHHGRVSSVVSVRHDGKGENSGGAPEGGFVSFVSSPSGHLRNFSPVPEPENDPTKLQVEAAERAALAIESGVPEVYAEPFAMLQVACPPKVPVDRWRQAVNDAGIFLDRWGYAAEQLGWPIEDVFGLHPKAPLSRFDYMGIIWGLRGARVLALAATEAVTENQGGARLVWRRPMR
jgi:hypothetical protein